MASFPKSASSKKATSHLNAAWFEPYRRLGLKRARETLDAMPKCGARSKQTGEPCKQPVKEAGKRCHFHGGATPKGRDWHRRQYPGPMAAPSRLNKKLLTLEVRDRKAALRRSNMTPEEREKHEKRREFAMPGTPLEREYKRRRKESKKLVEDLLRKKGKRSRLEQPAPHTAVAGEEGRSTQAKPNEANHIPEIFR